MQQILDNVKCNRHLYYETIIQNIEHFIYRDERYNASFSLAAVCSKEQTALNPDILHKELRKTDKIIRLSDDLLCIIFDYTTNSSYIKAAENLNSALKEIHFQENFYISTAESQEFATNYLNMINKLFDRLEFAIENNIYNTVVYDDYVI
jgi:hypothetical protein